MKWISLGGLCECQYQINRLGLHTESSFFSWIITPTRSLINLVQLGLPLSETFLRNNLQDRESWGKNRKIEDIAYHIYNVHDFFLDKSIDEVYNNVKSKFQHLSQKTINTLKTYPYLILCHRMAALNWDKQEEVIGEGQNLYNALKGYRSLPFRLILIIPTKTPPSFPENTDIFWYQRPYETSYNWMGKGDFWEKIRRDLENVQ